jgi:hypothetical protein
VRALELQLRLPGLRNIALPFAEDLELLDRCYEAACEELHLKYEIQVTALAELIATMTNALLDLYAAGQRDEQALTQYAVSRALIAHSYLISI